MNRFLCLSFETVLMTLVAAGQSEAQFSPAHPPPRITQGQQNTTRKAGTAKQNVAQPNKDQKANTGPQAAVPPAQTLPPAPRVMPEPPTPGGPLPRVTLLQPFGALPYFYQPSELRASPYARYLDSYKWDQPFHVTPLLNIPQYYVAPGYQWPYLGPIY